MMRAVRVIFALRTSSAMSRFDSGCTCSAESQCTDCTGTRCGTRTRGFTSTC